MQIIALGFIDDLHNCIKCTGIYVFHVIFFFENIAIKVQDIVTGKLRYLDMRQPGSFLLEGLAHEGGVEAIGMSCAKKGLMATGGADGVR